MVYVGALIGGITISLSIVAMLFLQSYYKGEKCEKARTIVKATSLFALVSMMALYIIMWLPLVPSYVRSLIACITSLVCIAIIIAGNIYAIYDIGTDINSCATGRMYSVIYIIVMALAWILTGIMTIF